MQRPNILTASAAEIIAWNEGGHTDGTEMTIEQASENLRLLSVALNSVAPIKGVNLKGKNNVK